MGEPDRRSGSVGRVEPRRRQRSCWGRQEQLSARGEPSGVDRHIGGCQPLGMPAGQPLRPRQSRPSNGGRLGSSLVRGALENASRAIWLLESDDRQVRLLRLLQQERAEARDVEKVRVEADLPRGKH